ncbi:hypothetical protein [Lujinxingia litoralis]|uniref:hypothetical protein n=1 Tax=Lujinxingia litoralis TaxID=2211119 RepID=UPI0011B94A26|nr:hypothetical protein [Lujinxingia litoralis]
MIRVILDTNVLRQFAYQDQPHLDVEAINNAQEDLGISIADGTFLELASQLQEQHICFDDWRKIVGKASMMLDNELPIFPGGCDLHRLSGVREDGEVDMEKVKLRSMHCWRFIAEANSLSELEREYRYLEGEVPIIMGGGPLPAEDLRQQKHQEWIKFVEDINKTWQPKKSPSAQEAAQAILLKLKEVDGFSGRQLDAAVPYARVMGFYLHLIFRGYGAQKNQNDVVDNMLFWHLSLPAVVVTDDRRLVGSRAIPAGISTGVVSVAEFNEGVKGRNVNGLLPKMETFEEFMKC